MVTLLSSPVTVNCVTPLRIISLKLTKADEVNMIMELEDNLDTLKEKTMWNYYQKNVIDPIVGLGIANVEEGEVERLTRASCRPTCRWRGRSPTSTS